jgi:hypothetical protein
MPLSRNKFMKKNNFLGLDLNELIKSSIDQLFEVKEDESVTNMQEKLKQQAAAAAANKNKKRFNTDPKEVAGDESEVQDSKPVKIKHEKLPEINEKSIADKINAIRSGKSLKDKETMAALKTYFQKLNGPERIALFAFLAGLEKVLGEMSGDVKTPHSKPFNIDMEKEQLKDKQVASQGSKTSSINDAGDNPIIVGERADTRSIKSKLWRK